MTIAERNESARIAAIRQLMPRGCEDVCEHAISRGLTIEQARGLYGLALDARRSPQLTGAECVAGLCGGVIEGGKRQDAETRLAAILGGETATTASMTGEQMTRALCD